MLPARTMEHRMAHGNPVGTPVSVPRIRSRAGSVIAFPAGNVTCLGFADRAFDRTAFRVLLAHDLTGQSEIALVRAARLALEREGHLTIVHVVDSALPAPVIEARREKAKRQVEAEVRRWLGRRALSHRIEIAVGDPAGAIVARAQARNVDLVVTGRHQRHALAAMFGLSTIGRLLRRVRRPLLAVGSPNQSPYRRVLVPIDGGEASAARVELAAALLPGAGLHLLWPENPSAADRVAIAPSFPALGGRGPILTRASGDAPSLVRKELARQKTDLLVLGPNAPSGMTHALFGSADEAILRASPCDVLFVPPTRAQCEASEAARS
jgi:nucleotide-binding universal stress UspA family protein